MTVTKDMQTSKEPEARKLRREIFDDEMLDRLMAARMSRVLWSFGGGPVCASGRAHGVSVAVGSDILGGDMPFQGCAEGG